MVITDNAGGVYSSSKTYTQTITIAVVNHSELRIRTATVSRPPLWTTMGSTLQVPVNFLAKGNAVRSSSFQVTFDSNCFSFAGVTGPRRRLGHRRRRRRSPAPLAQTTATATSLR